MPKNIKGAVVNKPIIGVFEGECADANITNLNGVDITRPVWENVFASDDFKQAIELGWYIGFLGHPEEPDCGDFEHACIVMTDGYIDEQGKVHGKFNLIDTPVGRIVKSFIDAGVTFGISVRGAGDIYDNSVDPDTFIFRGFDLVVFPAFPESIPVFTEIAASTDWKKRKQYSKICAAVKSGMDSLNTVESCEMVQTQFPENSDIYQMLENQKTALSSEPVSTTTTADMLCQQLDSMTQLYLDTLTQKTDLEKQLVQVTAELEQVKLTASRKVASMKRIVSSQNKAHEDEIRKLESKHRSQIRAAKQEAAKKIEKCECQLDAELDQADRDADKVIGKLENDLNNTKKQYSQLNLKYKQEIASARDEIRRKDRIISRLREDIDKTVVEASSAESRASNCDDKMNRAITAARQDRQATVQAKRQLSQFQKAYAALYASAIGADLEGITITATTSVEELQKLLGATNTSGMSAKPYVDEMMSVEIPDIEEEDGDLVTL